MIDYIISMTWGEGALDENDVTSALFHCDPSNRFVHVQSAVIERHKHVVTIIQFNP